MPLWTLLCGPLKQSIPDVVPAIFCQQCLFPATGFQCAPVTGGFWYICQALELFIYQEDKKMSLTHKQSEVHGCEIISVATDALVLLQELWRLLNWHLSTPVTIWQPALWFFFLYDIQGSHSLCWLCVCVCVCVCVGVGVGAQLIVA